MGWACLLGIYASPAVWDRLEELGAAVPGEPVEIVSAVLRGPRALWVEPGPRAA